MYTFRRYKTAYGAVDPDAAPSVLEGFNVSGEGACPVAYTLRLYKYHLDLALFYNVTANESVMPGLCWVLPTVGTMVGNPIAQDFAFFQAQVNAFQTLSFDHDFGPDGIEVYPPQPPGVTAYALGVVDVGGAVPTIAQCSIDIQYGIDLDYRQIANPAQAPA